VRIEPRQRDEQELIVARPPAIRGDRLRALGAGLAAARRSSDLPGRNSDRLPVGVRELAPVEAASRLEHFALGEAARRAAARSRSAAPWRGAALVAWIA